MSHPVRLLCAGLVGLAALLVGLPATAHARPGAVAVPDPLADVRIRHWGNPYGDAGVIAHAGSGRLMVYANDDKMGRFVHFGFGRSTASGGCKVTRWVVLDQQDNRHAWLYDAHWQPVEFTPMHLWGQYLENDYWMHYLRLGTEPDSFGTDCAKVAGHAHRDPASRQVGPTLAGDLGPMTNVGRHPTSIQPLPGSFPYEADAQLHYSVEARPDAALWDELVVPPVPVDVAAELPPGSGLEITGSDPPQTLDLWTYDAPVTGTVTVRPTSPYAVHPRIRVTADGLDLGEDGTSEFNQYTRHVSVPPPTGWSGTLAGQTLWGRAPDKWNEPYHSVFNFLDDEWVYITDQAADPVPATCDTVGPKIRQGCHRYYYDAASGQLQLDDVRLRPVTDPVGWQPTWDTEPLRPGTSVGPVPADTRLSYGGRGTSFNCTPLPGRAARGCAVSRVELVLHQDGTYRFTKVSTIDGLVKSHHGTYRFTGTSLVLDPAKNPPVTLDGVVGYFQDGVLKDLDWSVAGVYGAEG